MSFLRIEGLSKSFGSLIVTNNVNMTIGESERHVVIGPNGAGKTSLLNQISGHVRPSAGSIFFAGRDITYAVPERICSMGISRTFQKNNLFETLSVRENVALAIRQSCGLACNPFRNASQDSSTSNNAEEVLGMVGLGGSHRLVSELSYGEQRQVEVAMALASKPSLILLDEPTSGMSPAETEHMISLISNLPRTISILMIEHDMNVVFSIADHITVLHHGRILASGTPNEIMSSSEVREIYLGAEQ